MARLGKMAVLADASEENCDFHVFREGGTGI
jgi:hypothetical protein